MIKALCNLQILVASPCFRTDRRSNYSLKSQVVPCFFGLILGFPEQLIHHETPLNTSHAFWEKIRIEFGITFVETLLFFSVTKGAENKEQKL